jgi:hypothetical protein
VPLESFLARQAAKMVSFTFIRDFEFGRIFIKNYAADWVSKHFLWSYPHGRLCFPPIMVSGSKKAVNRQIVSA